ncbi:MAG: hypothetical protein EB100_00425 [Crocinitomicaceae bacterium]|nr:hypothetical protein [Crocinitomicaceae bacterium]
MYAHITSSKAVHKEFRYKVFKANKNREKLLKLMVSTKAFERIVTVDEIMRIWNIATLIDNFLDPSPVIRYIQPPLNKPLAMTAILEAKL